MIVIKGVPLSEMKDLVIHDFVHDVTCNQQASDDNKFYDITLKLNVQILTKKYGIVLFIPLGPTGTHYMDECMFMEVVIT